MWIASEMNKTTEPILHTVASDAAEQVEKILDLPGLIVEINGYTIVNRRAVKRRNNWLKLVPISGLVRCSL